MTCGSQELVVVLYVFNHVKHEANMRRIRIFQQVNSALFELGVDVVFAGMGDSPRRYVKADGRNLVVRSQ